MRLSPTACWSRRQPAKGGSLSGYLRRERATHCGKGTSGARLVHGGKGHPGHALYSKECGRCGLVTLRCALLRASSAAHYLGAGYRWKPPHQDSGELGALSWACPMVLRGRARGYASTGPLGPSLRKGGFDLTCCMAAAAGSGMRRRLAAAASSGGLRRRLAAASAAQRVTSGVYRLPASLPAFNALMASFFPRLPPHPALLAPCSLISTSSPLHSCPLWTVPSS